jgi:hypothetical protein
MGALADAWNTWLRAFVVEGNPGSGLNPPGKAEGRAIGALIEAAIGAADQTIAVSGSTLTLTLDYVGAWLECSDAAGMAITIPAQADIDWPDPARISGAQTDDGPLSFAGDVGVTLLVADNQDVSTAAKGAVWELRKIDTNTWRLYGNLTAI